MSSSVQTEKCSVSFERRTGEVHLESQITEPKTLRFIILRQILCNTLRQEVILSCISTTSNTRTSRHWQEFSERVTVSKLYFRISCRFWICGSGSDSGISSSSQPDVEFQLTAASFKYHPLNPPISQTASCKLCWDPSCLIIIKSSSSHKACWEILSAVCAGFKSSE